MPTQSPQQPFNLASLVARSPQSDQWQLIGLGSLPSQIGGVMVASSDEQNVQLPASSAGELRIARLGSHLHVLHKLDHASVWSHMQETPFTSEPIRIGLTAGAYAQPSDLMAEFDRVQFRFPRGRDDLFRD
jgi:hypothetical protein